MVMMRTAVVLFNLGGPDSRDSIRPFLKNFFMDKNIIQAPFPIRILVSSLIANRRSKREAGDSYEFLGGKSPLLENTLEQAGALEDHLRITYADASWKVFTAMRYWHPMSDEVARAVMDWQPDKIVLLPLYPQFSTTTTWSSAQEWSKSARSIQLNVPTRLVCCYPFQDGFIEASARLIKEAYHNFQDQNPGIKPRILFSAHGLPEKIIKGGDPYQWQCEEGARKIAIATGIENLDWTICYQSRVGPLKWIGPSTEDELHRAAKDNVGVLIYPHAFVSEHVETLVEIEIEYRAEAKKLGIPAFARIPTVGVSTEFIKGLASLVVNDTHQRLCPPQFNRCCTECSAQLKLCA